MPDNTTAPRGGRPLPLEGTLVVDATRMLPGAAMTRVLLDLGARVLKIEDPRGGDMMRAVPPIVADTGAGFAHFFRGAESVGADLRKPGDQALVRAIAQRADVFCESFRPGTLERWGLGLDSLREASPRLVTCSLPGFPSGQADVGHDLNFTGLTGLLDHLPHSENASDIPRVQVADVNSGLLAASSILAALLRRGIDGRGGHVEQPLLAGVLPLLGWAWSDDAAAARNDQQEPIPSAARTLLAGRLPCYRNYTCGDGKRISVGCLEPKFWIALVTRMDLPHLAPRGLDLGPDGQAAADEVAAAFASAPRAEWLDRLVAPDLPVFPVHDLRSARADARVQGLLEELPLPDGSTLRAPGPALPSVSATPGRPAPKLGEHTQAVRAEFTTEGG